MPAPAVVAAALQARVRRAIAARRAARAAQRSAGERRGRRRLVGTILTLGVVAFMLPMTAIVVAVGGTRDPHAAGAISALAAADIPPEALLAYREAAAVWGVDWSILAGVGKVECDHGRAQLPGCNPPGTVNRAGARGYMQFLGGTWRRGLGRRQLEPRSSPPAARGQGYATDGDGDGDADPWSWPDAVNSAARYLVALGVNEDPERALYGYNRSQAYVTDVLSMAMSYRASGGVAGATAYEGTPGNVPLATVEGITVHARLAPQVAGLVQAARADGIRLTGGGYRTPERQVELRRQNCGSSDYAIYEMPSGQCSPPTARPGTSNHEMGLAVDFSCEGGLIRSRTSACFTWMAANAPAYGLHNLPSEPWHWSVDGS